MQSARVDSGLKRLRGPGEEAAEGAAEGHPLTADLSSQRSVASPAALRSQHSVKGWGSLGIIKTQS